MFAEETLTELHQLLSLNELQHLIAARSILATTKTKPKDFTENGCFADRVVRKIKLVIPEGDLYAKNLLDAVCDIVQLNEQVKNLNGLGGSKPKSIKSILVRHHILN